MSSKLLALCMSALAMSLPAAAQIVPNNSYSAMIMSTNTMIQNSLSQMNTSQLHVQHSSGAYCSPVPPADLMRGADGHVPPELQGDPRYQAWLRCQGGQNTPQAVVPAQAPAAIHLPITATDFSPSPNGHPVVEQFLRSQPLNDAQRAALRGAFGEMSSRIAMQARPNNLAVAMAAAVCGAIYLSDGTDADAGPYAVAFNDSLGSSPQIAAMSGDQKQNLSDALIFQLTVAKLLADLGQSDPQAKAESVELAHAMLLTLTGSPTGRPTR